MSRLLALLLLVTVSTVSVADVSKPPRPNIIVVLSDDMGYSDLGCYGGEINTPALDALAAGGLRFTQFYNTGRCCPTRAALLTGMYSHQAGVGHMVEDRGFDSYRGELSKRTATIAEALGPVGYRNYAVGKWHVTRHVQPDGPKHNWPLQRGFHRYYGTITGAGSFYDPGTLTRDNTSISPYVDPEYTPKQYYYTDAIADHAIRFIKDHQQAHAEQPFFLYVAFTAAHWPMHALDEDIAKYRGKYDAGYEPIRRQRFARMHQLGLANPQWQLTPMVGEWETVKEKAWEARCMEVYAAMIDRMDQGIGRIVKTLQDTNAYDNTLVLYLQDNGACAETVGRQARPTDASFHKISDEQLRQDIIPKQTREGSPVRMGKRILPGPADTYIAYGENWANVSNTPFRLYKHWQHEGGIATPLIAHWPRGIPQDRRGQLEHQPSHLIDIMATCVELAGAEATSQGPPLEGVSLAPGFAGQPLNRPGPIFWEHEGNRAVRDGSWKLVSSFPHGNQWELYDMAADRTEMHNLAKEQPERVQSMAAQWDAWAARVGVQPWDIVNAAAKKKQ